MKRDALRLAYDVQRLIWKIVKPRTRGVRVMLFNQKGELLLVRHTYGRSDYFMLPGGGIRPFETPHHAAEREVKEEVGIQALELKLRAQYESRAEGKRDTIYLFEGTASGHPAPDSFEVAEAIFADLSALPPAVSPATVRRIQERAGQRQVDATW